MTEAEAEQLHKALFGRKSEKIRVLQTNDREISLFDEAEQEAKTGEPEPCACGTAVKAHTRKPKRKRDELLEGIPHEKKTIPLPEAERFCDRHPRTPCVLLGEKFVRTEVHYIPQKIKVIDIYQEAWQCLACKEEDRFGIKKASFSSVHPLVFRRDARARCARPQQKYALAVPFYRQESAWKALGLPLSRTNMAN